MKTVFSNHMVAHVWAQQTQESGRSHNGNFSFSGPTLYSYRTPIARIVLGAAGQRVALLTSNSYIVTTATKHMSPARYAVRRDMPAFTVPFIGERCGRNRIDSENEAEMHAANMAHFAALYAERIAKMLKARRWHNPTSDLYSLYNEELDYARCFGLDEPKRAPDVDVQPVLARFARLRAAENDPAAAAKRERERARREARKERQAREAAAEAIARWRAGDHSHRNWRSLTCMLRVKGDTVQTSWGADFPVEHARRAFPLLKQVRDTGQGWQKNGHTIHLGHFQIDCIEPDGTVQAGCHTVPWSEIEACAIALGLLEPCPA